jgi:hypothetical protein
MSEHETTRTTPIELEVHGSWEARALADVLASFHAFMVQRDHARWVVHARAPGCHGEPLEDALAAVEKWRETRERSAA